MTDKEIVQEVYESTIRQLCVQLFSALLIGESEAVRAEARFIAGVKRTKAIREDAHQLLIDNEF